MRLHRLHRAAAVWWLAAFTLAAATGLAVTRLVGRAEAQAARYGSVRTVAVAARPLDAGTVLAEGDVERRTLPAAFLPAAPVAPEPVGHALLVAVAEGEPLLEAKLAAFGVRGVASLLPPGTRALAVPVGPASPPLQRGDRVDVLATFDTTPAGAETDGVLVAGAGPADGAPTFPVAEGAVVVDVGEEAVSVAVRAEEAPRLAFTLARGTATIALTAAPAGGASGVDRSGP